MTMPIGGHDIVANYNKSHRQNNNRLFCFLFTDGTVFNFLPATTEIVNGADIKQREPIGAA